MSTRKSFLTGALLSFLMIPFVYAEEVRLLRFPSTNGQEIVFSYAGDLYKVPFSGGEARRLTSHVGYEMFPRFSPDGKTIAFTGQYDGNTEVFTIPSGGGEPVRITYTPTNARDDLGDRMGPNNMVMTWTPDGSSVVYRNRISGGFEGQLYQVKREGGLPDQIPLPEGGFCSFSPDGKKMAYNRVMREFRTWKYYKGGMADDIWIYDPENQQVENITNHEAQDIIPMWIGDEIFFLSDRDRTMNLFVYNTKTRQTEKVTDFTDYDIKFPNANGHWIVFEKGGYLYKMDARSRQYEKVTVSLSSDHIYARSEIKNGADYISSVSPSPDAERLAITARGEVFTLPSAKGVTKNITRTPGVHERNAQYSPDGKQIAWIGDQTGETELYMRQPDGGEAVQLTFNNDTYIRGFLWSPDARRIVYTDRMNRINLLDVDSRKVTTLLQCPVSEPRNIAFSPDNKWITYTRTAENNYSMVYLYNLAEKKEYPVTDKWYDSHSAVFSTDGKYLVFISERDFNPTYGSTEWNHVYSNMQGIYLALLSKETPSPFLSTDGVQSKEVKNEMAEPVQVRIDPHGLSDRIIHLPLPGGRYSNLYSNGSSVWFVSKGNTEMFDLAKQKAEVVVEGAAMQVSPGGKKGVFRKGKQVFVTDLPVAKTELKEEVRLADMKITTDYPQEWQQIFMEGWRAMRDGFYVENMHGVDWLAVRRKYEPLVPYVKNRMDLNYVIGEMIGELNCGHAYINPGEMDRPERINMGLLGAEIEPDKSGFFRISKLLEGASWSEKLRSPLTEPGIDARAGDYIVAIDGVPANSVRNLYELLVGKAGVLTEVSLNSKPQLSGARKAVISPLTEEYSLYHHNWIQENIRKVEEATQGKVGYIYIPDMGVDGLNEFSRYFYPQLDKEGLIIDDRANGGGNVSPMILERLAREPYRLTMRRGSERIGTVPDKVVVGPKVCLINKYSASDGDLFPWGFRALGLGKLIGTRTWGGIVGISASLPFMDGTDMRVPFFTSYDIKTGDWMVENEGVSPDIHIDNDPIKEWSGEDEQLNRAIEEIMKDIQHRKPLPGIPEPRNWSK